jgi:Predicted membrane protein
MVLGYVAAYSEFFGAILLLLGLLTRLDAFLLSSTMFVATFVVQLPDALRDPGASSNRLFAALHGIELPLSLLLLTLTILLLGPGRWSLDSLLGIESLIAARLQRWRGVPAPTVAG